VEKQKVSKKSNLLKLAPYDTMLLSHLRTFVGMDSFKGYHFELFKGIHRVTAVFKGVSKMIAIVSQHHSHWIAYKNSGGENGSNYSTDSTQTLSCKQLT
jgi:hypothetical protein